MKVRLVTRKEVLDAALLGELFGVADLTGANPSCLSVPSKVREHGCSNCQHFIPASCGHFNEWDCIASAIGASGNAVDLWLTFSNALHEDENSFQKELAYVEQNRPRREAIRMREVHAWAVSIRGTKPLNSIGDLESAVLLREGHLPPGWKRRR